MRILFISHSAGFEGAEQSLLALLQHWDKNRFEATVVLPSADGELYRKLTRLDIPVAVVPMGWWINSTKRYALKDFGQELKTADSIVALIKKTGTDIVYSNSIVTLTGALAAAICRVPHVWHVRELLKNHPLKSPLPLPAVFRLVGSLNDRVVAVSHAVAAQFPLGLRRERVRIVPNGVDPAGFARQPSDRLHAELSLPKNMKLVGVLGSVQDHKNQALAIRAFQTVAQRDPLARLIIAGREEPHYKKKLTGLIASSDLATKTFFLGFRQDIPSLLAELEAVVVPSVAEPFGRVTIEAMAAGKPVIATDTGASPEIVVHNTTGYLVGPDNPQAMAEAILDCLSDRQKARRMGLAGCQRVQQEFTVQKYVQGVQEILSGTSGISRGSIAKWLVRALHHFYPKSKSPIVK